MSSGTHAGTHSAMKSERYRTLTYRAHFAAMWQRFIVENFESPEHAAHVFRVDASTAANWFKGSTAPQGWVVGLAFADPNVRHAAIHHLTEGGE